MAASSNRRGEAAEFVMLIGAILCKSDLIAVRQSAGREAFRYAGRTRRRNFVAGQRIVIIIGTRRRILAVVRRR